MLNSVSIITLDRCFVSIRFTSNYTCKTHKTHKSDVKYITTILYDHCGLHVVGEIDVENHINKSNDIKKQGTIDRKNHKDSNVTNAVLNTTCFVTCTCGLSLILLTTDYRFPWRSSTKTKF